MPYFDLDRFVDLALAIQQIPAPTFNEQERAAFIHDRFLDEGLDNVEIDSLGNVLARLPGTGEERPLVVSAHLDSVFSKNVDLKANKETDKIRAPGIGDNAVGLAGLLGLVWKLEKYITQDAVPELNSEKQTVQKLIRSNLPGDIWLVANVREEGLGDLCGMRTIVARFGDHPRAYIILEGLSLGQIYHRGLGVRRYRILVRTAGGHSWVDFGRPSAIHELARLVTHLTELPLPSQPRSSMNVGIISGGTSVNTIAPEAFIELDLRSEDKHTLEVLIDKIEKLVDEANKEDVNVSMEVIGDRPVGELRPKHPLVLKAIKALKDVGVKPTLNIGSTDANIPLSLGLPAVCVGITTGGEAHTLNEYIHLQPIRYGMEQLAKLVEYVFDER
jgi:tripeptide aminopeptidase